MWTAHCVEADTWPSSQQVMDDDRGILPALPEAPSGSTGSTGSTGSIGYGGQGTCEGGCHRAAQRLMEVSGHMEAEYWGGESVCVCGGREGECSHTPRLVHEHHVHGSFSAWGLQCIGCVSWGGGAWSRVPPHQGGRSRRPFGGEWPMEDVVVHPWSIPASLSNCAACD